EAMNHVGQTDYGLWDEEDGFYYDLLSLPDGSRKPIRIRSGVGYITLFAVGALEPKVVDKLPGFRRRMEWFLENNTNLQNHIDGERLPEGGVRSLLCVVNLRRLPRVMRYLLDEEEFLAPHGIRALSRYPLRPPYRLPVDGYDQRVDYEPAESTTGL